MAPHPTAPLLKVKRPKPKWSMTVMMNARDLSRDDDFLSHLLVEHLGTEDAPLQVHKMDPSRRLPKHDPADVLVIVKKYIVRKGGTSTAAQRVKRAVDALLELPAVKQYLHKRSPAQINAFATHASRYFELYLPTGTIEISHTSRYSHRTGKSELCILATTHLKVGQVITDLKGSLAHLTAEEDEELKRTDTRRRDGGIRRDFSVIHSNQKNRSHLFLGPARFVNHDCDHNVELFRDGRIITFRVIKPIMPGQEVTAHYGDGYFGKSNRHCLCQTCEMHGRGGYAPAEDNESEPGVDDSSTDEETREARIRTGLGLDAKGNPNERRTRRGVYAIVAEADTDDEDRVGENGPSVVGSTFSAGKPGNASIHRRLSDASTLTSLSDSEIPSPLIQNSFAPSAFSSATPSRQPSLSIDNRGTTETPQTSRQSSGDAQDTLLSNATREKELVTLENHKSAIQKVPRPIARPPKRALIITSVSESQRTSKSGTSTPSKPPKPQRLTPRCGTCSNEITQLAGQKFSKNTVHTCTRCRRHFAIYGSHYPNRTANLEAISSSSSGDDSDDIHKSKHVLLDSSGRRRKTDSLSGFGRFVSNGQSLWDSTGKSPAIGEKRKWDAMSHPPEKEKIIRRIGSAPSLPFARPIPILYARPSPVLFAKSSWTTAQFIDRGRDDDMTNPGSLSTRSSIHIEGTTSAPVRTTRQLSSAKAMSTTPLSLLGLKRKRDSLSESRPREKIGRTFYMKDGTKKMPKGWVLVTDSSSETDDEDALKGNVNNEIGAGKHYEEFVKVDVLSHESNITNPLEADLSTSAAIAARADSPGPITTVNPSNNLDSPKGKKIRDPLTDINAPGADSGARIPNDRTFNNSSPQIRARMKGDDSTSSMNAPRELVEPHTVLHDDVESPPGMTNSGTTSECSVDTLANENHMDNGDLTVVETSLSQLDKNVVDSGSLIDIQITTETVKERELAQSALKISNLIHGTAFSFGHPDARSSWKPKYRYDELLGWVSESVPLA